MAIESTMPPLVLASGSPRRRLLLSIAGYRFDVVQPDVEEVRQLGESAREFVMRMAQEKASAVAAEQPSGTCVLGFDTSVVLGDRILGKPADETEAAEMLLSLAGRTHTVYTGYCLQVVGSEDTEQGMETARVTMRDVSAAEAADYADTGEPLDKAGAYALQGRGRGFVTQVDGPRSTVIGLPLERITEILARRGIVPARCSKGTGCSMP